MIDTINAYDISNRNLHVLPQMSHMTHIRTVNASDNFIKLTEADVANLPPNITTLILNNNEITTMMHTSNFPQSLKNLSLKGNDLYSFYGYPLAHIEVLDISNCKVRSITTLPPKIVMLDASDNDLYNMPTIPPNLTTLNVNYNMFFQFPWVNHYMDRLDICHNRINIQPSEQIKQYIKELNMANNPCSRAVTYGNTTTYYPNGNVTTYYPNYTNYPLYQGLPKQRSQIKLNDLSERQTFVI